MWPPSLEDKGKFREWNTKFINAMDQVDAKYGEAMAALMKWADAESVPDMESCKTTNVSTRTPTHSRAAPAYTRVTGVRRDSRARSRRQPRSGQRGSNAPASTATQRHTPTLATLVVDLQHLGWQGPAFVSYHIVQ